MSTLIGKIVLTLTMLWVLLCTSVFVLRSVKAIDPPYWPPVMDVTLFIMTVIGAIYSVVKLNEWIEDKGNEKEESEE